ncbi:DUF2786 domain-containing protein [Kitasatospora sp. NPDC057940]|uniref:DUF2786 domain-containing protein n=1 Tax=Kitasatospora sp. NPDC057940 TaxID=3346285 RepID=UPI0036D97315
MTSQNNPMLAKVRAILAKAEDPAASPAESEAYFAKAAALMAKYGIEETMLAAAKALPAKPTSRLIKIEGTYAKDRQQLLNHVAVALGASTVLTKVRDETTDKVVSAVDIFAYESDLDRIELLYTSLMLQAFNGMRHVRPLPGESTTSYRKTWLSGFATAVYHRLKKAEEDAQSSYEESTGTSTALVLADRKTLIEVERGRKYKKLRKTPKRKLTGSGWGAGSAAGQRADLGGNRLAETRRPALVG